MENWNNSDIGRIIRYRNKINEEVDSLEEYAIFKTYPKTDFIGVIEYPISLSSKYKVSKILRKNEKLTENELNNSGEWHFKGKVSKDELSVLERIAKSI